MKKFIPTSAAALALAAFLAGCSEPAATTPELAGAHSAADDHDHAGHSGEGHSRDGWWCNEHGVPEEVCALCDSKLAAKFQRDGDWCEDHERPDSQCFVCHPELEARFAAQYEAKYGEKPPKPKG